MFGVVTGSAFFLAGSDEETQLDWPHALTHSPDPHVDSSYSLFVLNATEAVCADLLCVCVPFQGVWPMEGQQPGGGEAGKPGRLRRPRAAPRSRLPERRPPAGEAAKPPGDYRESNQEIWHPPSCLCHSGR